MARRTWSRTVCYLSDGQYVSDHVCLSLCSLCLFMCVCDVVWCGVCVCGVVWCGVCVCVRMPLYVCMCVHCAESLHGYHMLILCVYVTDFPFASIPSY